MSCELSKMIIVMARRVCSPLACLTSLTPPEQAARLNNKVISANLSWFRAPRKIDTYFSFLPCSLKYDIINCSSSSSLFFFFHFSFGDLRLRVTGFTEQGSLCVCDHQEAVSELWNSIQGERITGDPGLNYCHCWKQWGMREVGSVSATVFIFILFWALWPSLPISIFSLGVTFCARLLLSPC